MTTPASTPASTRRVPPRTPAHVPDHYPLRELADRHDRHATVLTRGTPHLTRAEKRTHGEAALATLAVLLDRLDRARWGLAVAALRAGLTVDEAAESMGLDPSSLLVLLAVGLNERWPADKDRDEEYFEVTKLIAEATPDTAPESPPDPAPLDPADLRIDIYRTGINQPVGARVVHLPTMRVGTGSGRTEIEARRAALAELEAVASTPDSPR